MSISHLKNVNDPMAKFLNISCNQLQFNNASTVLNAAGSIADATGSLAPVVVGKMRIISCTVPASSGNGITKQNGGVTACLHVNGSGQYNLTYAGFASAPYAFTQSDSVAGFVAVSGVTQTTCQVNTANSGGVATDRGFDIMIIGPAL